MSLSYDDLVSLTRTALPRARLELHCHPLVMAFLRQAPPSGHERQWLDFWGSGMLTGIPVYEHPEMEAGAWELRRDGKVIRSDTFRFRAEIESEEAS